MFWGWENPVWLTSLLILFPVKQRHGQASSIQNCPYKLFKLIPGFTHFHHCFVSSERSILRQHKDAFFSAFCTRIQQFSSPLPHLIIGVSWFVISEWSPHVFLSVLVDGVIRIYICIRGKKWKESFNKGEPIMDTWKHWPHVQDYLPLRVHLQEFLDCCSTTGLPLQISLPTRPLSLLCCPYSSLWL